MLPVALMKALLRTTPKAEAVKIPRLERALEARVADERQLETFRRLTHYPDNGYLPVTWPFIAGWRAHLANLMDPQFPLPLPGLVHVRSRIEQRRPIGAGEAVRPICRVEGGRETDKGLEFDLTTEAFVGATLVWQGVTTVLARRPRGDLPQRPHGLTLDGVGAVNRIWLVPARIARGYAILSGDINPIHLSAATARLFGFKGTVAHGMWSLSRILGEHPELLTQPGLEARCDFKRPLVLPAQVIYRHWTEQGTVHFRLLDARATVPHAAGTLKV